MIDSNITKLQLKEKYGDEQVFAVPFSITKNIKDKFNPAKDSIGSLSKWDGLGQFIARYDAEYNFALQQLIPYVVILNKTGTKFYVARRKSGEERLKNSYSIGFGGHINPCDGSAKVVEKAMYRELNEEVSLELISGSTEFIGHIRDLNSSTKDHLGFVFTVRAKNVKIKEKDSLEGKWMSFEQLYQNYYDFEGWAKYIIDFYYSNSINKTS